MLLMLQASTVGFDDVEPPVVGRPDHFSGAVGSSFLVALHANPPEVRIGDSFTLTVRVMAAGPWQRPPIRLKLEEIKGFKEHFRIDRSKSNLPDRVLPTPQLPWTSDRRQRPPRPIHIRETPAEQRSWEFDYRLTPLSESIDEVPPIPFAYYRPPRSEGLPGSFPTAFADAIPLKVLPREVVKPPPVKIEAPDGILRIVTADRPQSLFRLPALPWLMMLALLPPLMALGWYVLWQRLYPDAARLARRRQSRAAQAALRELDKVKGTVLEQARRVSEIVAEYLRDRHGLPGLEPTPGEVAGFLPRAGVRAELVQRMVALLKSCDTIRFAPEPPEANELTRAARDLIVDLENPASAKPPSAATDA